MPQDIITLVILAVTVVMIVSLNRRKNSDQKRIHAEKKD